jgi:hypothetical protein
MEEHSEADGMQSQNPKQANSWNSESVIVYDATAQTLTIEQRANLNKSTPSPTSLAFLRQTSTHNRQLHYSPYTETIQEPVGQRQSSTCNDVR